MDIEKIRKALVSYYPYNLNDDILLFKDQKTDKVGAAAYSQYLFITQEYGNQVLDTFNNYFFTETVDINTPYASITGYGYTVYITKKPDYAAIVYRETRQLGRALEIGDREQWVS